VKTLPPTVPAPTLEYHRPDPRPARSALWWGVWSAVCCALTLPMVLGVREFALKAVSPTARYYVWIELDAVSMFAYGGAFVAAALGIIGIAIGRRDRRCAVGGLVGAVVLAIATVVIKSTILGRVTF